MNSQRRKDVAARIAQDLIDRLIDEGVCSLDEDWRNTQWDLREQIEQEICDTLEYQA